MNFNKQIKSFISAVGSQNATLAKQVMEKILMNKARIRLKEREKDMAKTLFSESVLNENVIEDLKTIIRSGRTGEVRFQDGDSLAVDLVTARKLMNLYGRATSTQKAALVKLMNKDAQEFMQIVDKAK